MNSLLRDAGAIWAGSKNPLVTAIYCANVALYGLRTKTRIKHFPATRLTLGGHVYYADSWDGLLVVRPGHEPLVKAAVEAVANETAGTGTFVNVGAHIGRYCIEFAGKFARMIAYEPTPATYRLWSKAVAEHPDRARIDARQRCVADKAGPVLLQLSTAESQNSIVAPHAENRQRGTVEVMAVTLDEDLTAEEKQTLRLLLIDVEGAEHLVLAGARETLRIGRPVVIAEFLSEDRRLECDALLTELGYRGTRIDPTNWRYAPA